MSRSRARAIAVAGLVAGLLANYWLLEGLLADRTDPAGSWISDLGARSEDGGWLFALLDSLAGVAMIAFAIALRPLAEGDRRLRRGLIALGASGLCSVLDGALVNSCAEGLTDSCELSWDAIDVAHAIESSLSVVITVAAFALTGGALRDRDDLRRAGRATIALGAVWTVLSVLALASYSIAGLEEADGAFQRAAQVVLGVWLAGLGIAVARGLSRTHPRPSISRATVS
jgi:hypothetical protein